MLIAYFVIFAFSKCFLPLAESDLVQTVNSISLYNMRMRIEAKMSYEYLMRLPTVGRSSTDGRPINSLQLIKVIGEVCFNVIAPVGRQNCIYRPIKMQNSPRPTIGRLSVLM